MLNSESSTEIFVVGVVFVVVVLVVVVVVVVVVEVDVDVVVVPMFFRAPEIVNYVR